MPEISVIIDNYNYSKYIGEAIQSVLSQDFPDFELIIVDDGSTDDSRDIISLFTDSRIKKIFKENGGQLSAFNEGFEAATGKIVCFLDSDDLYQQGYLRTVAKYFSQYPDCGCLLGKVEYFGEKTGTDSSYSDGFYGCNPFSVAARHVWRGASTSVISIRRESLAKFLPYHENEKYWKTRADDLLIWGTDLIGANKYCFSRPTVKYRIHGHNLFFGKKDTSDDQYIQRRTAAEQFCKTVMQRNDLTLPDMLKTEIKYGNTSFFEKILSFLKLLKDRTISGAESCKCAWYLLLSLLNRR